MGSGDGDSSGSLESLFAHLAFTEHFLGKGEGEKKEKLACGLLIIITHSTSDSRAGVSLPTLVLQLGDTNWVSNNSTQF